MSTLQEIAKKHRCFKMERWGYANVYPRYLEELRGETFPMFEIGVADGKSLRMWREYLPHAEMAAVDIDPACAAHGPGVHIQDVLGPGFPEFARSLPRPRVVIDDGGHIPDQQRRAWDVLWPLLEPGGLYVVEDFHIWNEGGFMYHVAGLAVEVLQTTRRKVKQVPRVIYDFPPLSVAFVHAYPGIAVIGKL